MVVGGGAVNEVVTTTPWVWASLRMRVQLETQVAMQQSAAVVGLYFDPDLVMVDLQARHLNLASCCFRKPSHLSQTSSHGDIPFDYCAGVAFWLVTKHAPWTVVGCLLDGFEVRRAGRD